MRSSFFSSFFFFVKKGITKCRIFTFLFSQVVGGGGWWWERRGNKFATSKRSRPNNIVLENLKRTNKWNTKCSTIDKGISIFPQEWHLQMKWLFHVSHKDVVRILCRELFLKSRFDFKEFLIFYYRNKLKFSFSFNFAILAFKKKLVPYPVFREKQAFIL